MDKRALKELIIATATYSLGSILGPLLILGGSGFIIDRLYQTSPWGILGGVLIAFITTHILLFKKLGRINRLIEANQKPTKSSADSQQAK